MTTELPISPHAAWELVQSPVTMRYVSWPLTVFSPLDPASWRSRWQPGDYRFRMRALAVLPIGEQTVSISFPESDPVTGRYQLRDNGHGQLVRTWDHRITIEPVPADAVQKAGSASIAGQDRTRYTDRIDVDAGRLTVPVWLWAHVLYRWRQHRWRKLSRHRQSLGRR
ncbi:MAG: hypothetical protein ABWY26_06885 [Microbacterium sp.]